MTSSPHHATPRHAVTLHYATLNCTTPHHRTALFYLFFFTSLVMKYVAGICGGRCSALNTGREIIYRPDTDLYCTTFCAGPLWCDSLSTPLPLLSHSHSDRSTFSRGNLLPCQEFSLALLVTRPDDGETLKLCQHSYRREGRDEQDKERKERWEWKEGKVTGDYETFEEEEEEEKVHDTSK
ncbi:hypothetical protein E2C01_075303 [Portunus trituberculatus]|uniref:Uncharacterized protein n=1 Tax=Portunus trituberculatus TaxID=210409 RepID=A0A5B7IER3_PORTR|nr:hypothetical protein [Portunus trituberculatus]